MGLDQFLSGNSGAASIPAKPVNLTWLAALFWLVLASVLVARAVLHHDSLYLSTDDNMRLAEVRDWLAGQSWFDTTQHRMNTPYGLAMHWSRLIDAGIGGLILLFRLVMSPRHAELAALYIWPVLSLLPVFIAVTWLGARLAGREGGLFALLLMICCFSVTSYFQPGSIDHHNVHMALALWGVVFLLDIDKYPGAAIGLGLVSALSLAIGLETLPFLMLTSAVVAYFWIAYGNAASSPVRNFGLVFAGAAAALLIEATSTAERLGAACDTYSSLFAILAVAGGAGLALLTLIPSLNQSVARRAGGFAVLAVALLAITLITAPDCLYGPYAHVDARFDYVWLSRIEEVLSPLATSSNEPGYFFATYVYTCAGFVASLAAIFLVERDKRDGAIIVSLFAALALAINTAEVRFMPFAMLFVLPGLAAAITRLIARCVTPGTTAAAVTVAALVLSSNLTFDVIGHEVIEGNKHVDMRTEVREAAVDCMRPAAVTQLAALPEGRVAAMVDQGPDILTHSHDAVIAGPYHRNARGILDTYDLFTKQPSVGARILRERGIDYVMICPSSPDYTFYFMGATDNGLIRLLDDDKPPPWLTLVPKADKDQAVEIYRVLRDRLAD